MNLAFRILLAVYGFCLTIVSFVLMIITFKPEIFDKISSDLSYQLTSNRNASFVVFIIAFIFFSISLSFLLSGFKSSKDKKAVSKHTNIGEVKISLGAIESIALTAAKKLSGVKETKAYVYKSYDSVSVLIKTVVMADINIPALSEDIQVRVKKSIEDSSGIIVSDVKVIVENIYTGYKARVE